MNSLLKKMKSWESMSFLYVTSGYMRERCLGEVDEERELYANLFTESVVYRKEIESIIEFVNFLKLKLEEVISGESEEEYGDEYWHDSVFEEIFYGFTEGTFSPIEHNKGLINYIETQYKIEDARRGGFKKFFPNVEKIVLTSDGKVRPATQKDDLSQESASNLEMIENLNTLEHFRHTLQVAYEILTEGGTPLSILTYLRDEGLLESSLD